MNLDFEEFKEILEVLAFYANSDNYWSKPLPLENNYCRRTLQDVLESKKHNKILVDRGEKANKILEKIQDSLEQDDPVMKFIAPICDSVIRLEKKK
jgi:hypothetical protein